jgi:hypothetical protein
MPSAQVWLPASGALATPLATLLATLQGPGVIPLDWCHDR